MKDKIYMVYDQDDFNNMKFFTSFESAKKYMGKLANQIAKSYKKAKKDYSDYPREICIEGSSGGFNMHCSYVFMRELSGINLKSIEFEKGVMKDMFKKQKEENN